MGFAITTEHLLPENFARRRAVAQRAGDLDRLRRVQLADDLVRVGGALFDPDLRGQLARPDALAEPDADAAIFRLTIHRHAQRRKDRVADAAAVAGAAGGAGAPADVHGGGRLEAELLVVRGGAVDLRGKEVELLADDLHGLAREVAVLVLDAVHGGEEVAVVRAELRDQRSDLRSGLGFERHRAPLNTACGRSCANSQSNPATIGARPRALNRSPQRLGRGLASPRRHVLLEEPRDAGAHADRVVLAPVLRVDLGRVREVQA